jgi:uncharacterized membrane protein
MIDLHPACSGLPLAGVLLLIASELLVFVTRLPYLRDTLRATAVVFCLLAVTCAFLSGYQASSVAGELQPVVEGAMANHHSLGRFLLINSVLLATFFWLMRIAVHGKSLMLVLYYLAFLVQVILTAWVGYLGGQLVFSHGVNVRGHNETPYQLGKLSE